MHIDLRRLAILALILVGPMLWAQAPAAVPKVCTPEVNRHMAELYNGAPHEALPYVTACGTVVREPQPGPKTTLTDIGEPFHNTHVMFQLPDRPGLLLGVIFTSDGLTGVPLAKPGDMIFVHGVFTSGVGLMKIYIHSPWCATTKHKSEDGWVSVNDVKMPASCPELPASRQ